LNKTFPRVIIVGETFRLNGGGGITMFNLFKEWPKEKIGVITTQIDETDPTTGYRYYQLGNLEIKHPFPFNLFQTRIHSGEYKFNIQSTHIQWKNRKNVLHGLKSSIRKLFDNIITILGISYKFYAISPSNQLLHWIRDFDPDIIYVQPFLHKTMIFGNLLYERLRMPYAIHIMDDSVRYVNKAIIRKKACQAKIDEDFKQLVNNARSCLCISDAMADEYLRRYDRRFISFRNPVETHKWLPYKKPLISVNPDSLRIIYTGRLFSPTLVSLLNMCRVIDNMVKKGLMVELHIYTHDKNKVFYKRIDRMKGIKVLEPVGFNEMPHLISKYDIFFMCLDSDRHAQKYSRYSISTRTSEGMISGVPILVYAPDNTALYRYFKMHDAGLLLHDFDETVFEKSIMKLWTDIDLRTKLSSNAMKQVLNDSDASVVRENFRKCLINNKKDVL